MDDRWKGSKPVAAGCKPGRTLAVQRRTTRSLSHESQMTRRRHPHPPHPLETNPKRSGSDPLGWHGNHAAPARPVRGIISALLTCFSICRLRCQSASVREHRSLPRVRRPKDFNHTSHPPPRGKQQSGQSIFFGPFFFFAQQKNTFSHFPPFVKGSESCCSLCARVFPQQHKIPPPLAPQLFNWNKNFLI